MKRYDSYKDSGVEWIGETPSHWNNIKLGYLGSFKSGNGFPETIQGKEDGDFPFFKVSDTNSQGNEEFLIKSNNRVTDKDFENYKWNLFDKNTIVFPKIGMALLNNKRRLLNQPSFIDNNMMGFTTNSETDYKFSYYLLKLIDFKNFCSGGTIPSIGESQISPIKVFLPPILEQQQIVSFLDTKTSLIDSLIEKTEQKSRLLKERLLVSVEEVLLNKKVKRERLKHVVDLVQRPIERTPTETFNKIGMYNRGRGIFKYPDELGLELGDSTFNYIKEKDLLLSGQFSWEGSVSIVQKEHNNCISSHRFHILNGHENKILNEYLWSYFISQEGHWMLNINSFGSGGRNRPLNIMRLLNEKIPVPNIETQKKIRDFVFEYDFYKKYEEERIKLLKEYKQSLISEVVTGKERVVS